MQSKNQMKRVAGGTPRDKESLTAAGGIFNKSTNKSDNLH